MNPELKAKHRLRTLDLVYIALMAVLITVCSWISLPFTVPFTMQTFAVFCALALLGGKRGTAAIAVYLALGMIGLPVFAEFDSGFSALLGTTGGYLWGFLLMGLIAWLMTARLGTRLWVQVLALVLGLAACYAVGTAWFMFVYARQSGAVGLVTALGWCVFPFILPDLTKMALALLLARRLRPFLK